MSDEFEKDDTEEEVDLTAALPVDDDDLDAPGAPIPLSTAIRSGALGDDLIDPEDIDAVEEEEEEDDVPEGMYGDFEE